MDQASQERLDTLLNREPETYTPEERDFVYARRGYIPKNRRDEFKEFILANDARVKEEATQTEK